MYKVIMLKKNNCSVLCHDQHSSKTWHKLKVGSRTDVTYGKGTSRVNATHINIANKQLGRLEQRTGSNV